MKTLFFYVHWLGIIIVNFGWVFSSYIKYVQACVLMYWLLNKNRCVLSQLEHYYFGETFLKGSPNAKVPLWCRLLLWSQFAFACLAL